MRLGIDIDDTITNTKKYVIDLKKKVFPDILDPTALLPKDVFMEFINKYDDEIHQNVTLKEDVCDVLNWLKEKGHELYFITARGNYSTNSEKDTITYFQKYAIPYDKIIFNVQNKGKVAYENGIDIFIDDKEEMCNSVHKYGIDCLRIIEDITGESNFKKFSSWKDIMMYLKLYESIPKIAIDIDDTITNTYDVIKYYLKKFKPKSSNNFYSLDQQERDKFMRLYGELIHEEALVKERVVDCLNYLKESGYKIFILTARGNNYTSEREKTVNYLLKNKIPYDHVIFSEDKIEKCYHHNIKILIDDRKENFSGAAKYNIECFLMNSEEGDNQYTPCFLNWEEALKYFKERIDGTNNN